MSLLLLTLSLLPGSPFQGTVPTDGAGDTPAPTNTGSSMDFLIPMVLVVVIFYVIMIGPEKKQRKKREEMLAALKKGDRIITNGGLYASVAQVQDQVVTLQVADGVRMRFALQSVQALVDETAKEEAKAS